MFTILFTALAALAVVSASPVPQATMTIEVPPTANIPRGARIRSHRSGQCLAPLGGQWGQGTQVGLTDCTNAPNWWIAKGSGSILLEGYPYALDAGTGKDNNELVKLWDSYPTLFQQTWYYTDDDRIAITGGDQCLDEGDNGYIQTYKCTTGNTNQIWTLLPADGTSTAIGDPTLISSISYGSTVTATSSVLEGEQTYSILPIDIDVSTVTADPTDAAPTAITVVSYASQVTSMAGEEPAVTVVTSFNGGAGTTTLAPTPASTVTV